MQTVTSSLEHKENTERLFLFFELLVASEILPVTDVLMACCSVLALRFAVNKLKVWPGSPKKVFRQ